MGYREIEGQRDRMREERVRERLRRISHTNHMRNETEREREKERYI